MSTFNSTSGHHPVFSVSELNRDVRTLLERGFPLIKVEGEISNFSCPGSGHWYLTLKDGQAQVRCAMFRNRNRLTGLQPENGMQVLVTARVSLYEARGEFQLILENMEEAGFGALQRAFEALKGKLQGEGLFNAEHKRQLPVFPRQIGVITSPTGAAIRDVISVLKRRFPAIPVIIYPTPVQGEGAAEKIVAALAKANQRAECDVLILTRGGGSLEDLWSFNEEAVARAVFKSEIPVVSAVGHEVDFTIADFVADQRAATPSAAAELVSPDQISLNQEFVKRLHRISGLMRATLGQAKVQFTHIYKRLQHPSRKLQEQSQRLDELEQRLLRATLSQYGQMRGQIKFLRASLLQHSPAALLGQHRQSVVQLEQRLVSQIRRILEVNRHHVEENARALDAISPLAVLRRGYSILTHEKTGRHAEIIRSGKQVKKGDSMVATLAEGRLKLSVLEVVDEK